MVNGKPWKKNGTMHFQREGKKVEVDIKINYADNLRPTDFDVTYIIKTSDGKIEKTENLFFLN